MDGRLIQGTASTSHQVPCSLNALAALVAQLDVPAGGQQDGQGRLHAH